ncbi:MAG: LamG domain-containing protein [Lachnospiraceae bacterium]|nr:LamG domain-containing protein [Lachnospiraceae bacterium]
MNTNGFQALYCSKDGYAEIPWTYPAGSQYSIVVRFLPDDLPKDGTLFSLGEYLRVGFTQTGDFAGRIQVSGTGFSLHSDHSVLPRFKNTLAAIFMGQDLEIYCNGIFVLKQTLSDHLQGASSLRIGEKLSAVCVFDVTIFHRMLTPLEIQQCCIKKPVNFEKRILFSESEAPAGVTLHQCRIENCVYTLDCREGGFCLPDVGLPEKYTISLSLYLTDENCQDGILFQSSGFQVKIFYERGRIASQLTIHHTGGPEFNVPRSFERDQWINITFSFDGSQCSIYFDGSPAMVFDCRSTQTQAENITFGPFDGYMDTCTIVRSAVPQDKIVDFLQNPPGIFHRDLLYLCDFSRREFLESRRNTDLTSHGAKIVLARGTGALTGVKREIDAPDSQRPYSKFVNWQIGVLLQLLVEWIYEQFGIYPNRGNIDMDKDPWEIEISLRQFIHKEILSMPEAQDILIDYDNINSDKLLELIQAMEKNGTLRKLIDYLYQEDEEQDKVADLIEAMLKAAMLAAVISAIKAMLTGIKPIPKPPKTPDSGEDHEDDDDDDDDDDKKKKKTYVRVKQVFLKGDMNITMSGGGYLGAASDTTVAETEKVVTAVFFKKNGTKNPTLEVTLSFKGDKDVFTVTARNMGSQVIAGIEETVSYSGSNSRKITCPVNPGRFNGSYGKCTETLRWHCHSEDGKQSQFLGETDFELYFLEEKPCGPWQKDVPVECLALCADCAEYAGENSAGFFEDYINYIGAKLSSRKNAAVGAESVSKKSFSRIDPAKTQKSVFYARKFSDACRFGKGTFTYNDGIYSAAIFGFLNGDQSVGTMGLCSGITWHDENQSVDGAHLLFEKEGGSCPEEYIHSVITKTGGIGKDLNIYDPLLDVKGLPFSENPDSPVTGEHNSRYYREGNYVCGSYCQQFFSLSGENWQIGDDMAASFQTDGAADADRSEGLSETPAVGLVGPVEQGYGHTYRTNIDRDVRRFINTLPKGSNSFNEVCHSISACQIDTIIADICNDIVQHHQDNGKFALLIEALYPEVPQDGNDFATHRRRLTEHLAATLERRLAIGNRDLFTDTLVEHFSCLAGNSPANLRWGNGGWNRSIRDNFDPEKWFYFLNENSECVISDREFDEHCQSGHLIETLTTRYQGIPEIPLNQPGYYLADVNDGIRIAKLREMGYEVSIIRKYVVDQACGANIVFYPLIACSGNRFPHEGQGGVRDCYIDPPMFLPPIPIFYISTDEQNRHVWTHLT